MMEDDDDSEEINQEDCWELITAYFDEKGLVRQQVPTHRPGTLAPTIGPRAFRPHVEVVTYSASAAREACTVLPPPPLSCARALS